MASFCAFTMVGPTFAPMIAGYVSVSPMGWRMAFWIGVIIAAVSLPLLFLCPETYGPVLLVHRAQKLRKEGDKNAIAPLELDERSLSSIFATTLTRPFRMFWKESIVFLTSIFLALLYGTLYLFFTSYPLIFQGPYCQEILTYARANIKQVSMDFRLAHLVSPSSHLLLVHLSHVLLRCRGINIFVALKRRTPNGKLAPNTVAFPLLTSDVLFTSPRCSGKHGQREKGYTG